MPSASSYEVRGEPVTPPVVEFRDVSKSFRQNSARVDALVHVSLAIRPAEFVVLTGPSGSGKSTLLHLAAGLETPTSGTIEVAGVDLGALEDDELSRLRCSKISLIFQALGHFFRRFSRRIAFWMSWPCVSSDAPYQRWSVSL